MIDNPRFIATNRFDILPNNHNSILRHVRKSKLVISGGLC